MQLRYMLDTCVLWFTVAYYTYAMIQFKQNLDAFILQVTNFISLSEVQRQAILDEAPNP